MDPYGTLVRKLFLPVWLTWDVDRLTPIERA